MSAIKKLISDIRKGAQRNKGDKLHRVARLQEAEADALEAAYKSDVEPLVEATREMTKEVLNQDEQGGCVFCGRTPKGNSYGYATQDHKDHYSDCSWLAARAALAKFEKE